MPEFFMTIQTVASRKQCLEDTLKSLAETDWSISPVIVEDTANLPNKEASQGVTGGKVLSTALAVPGWDYLLACEDDVIFNKNLRHNLTEWAPVKHGICLVGTLYHGGEVYSDTAKGYGMAPCGLIAGSQGVVIRRDWAEELLRRWGALKRHGMTDLRFFRSLDAVFPFVFVHNPNLVQHKTEPSIWGGPKHTTSNFSPDYKS
ncbi:hypothetical protein [Frigoriglobus tundricola]|uniref:Glycosyltransferase 2-like domain-containing protein n=1 Tax=Frigoriglobus tundricola TaxID=2774151 RepID=A0A6M5YJV6_9BACT|nr:hypothetical protein [Frigoriglobus tundricola]QJW93262.1 hypothetical protein FTUN_0767 [Frigoriglobus tundricola]